MSPWRNAWKLLISECLCTHHIVLAKVAGCPVAADVEQKDDVVTQVGTVGEATQGHEQLPGQEHVRRAYGHNAN